MSGSGIGSHAFSSMGRLGGWDMSRTHSSYVVSRSCAVCVGLPLSCWLVGGCCVLFVVGVWAAAVDNSSTGGVADGSPGGVEKAAAHMMHIIAAHGLHSRAVVPVTMVESHVAHGVSVRIRVGVKGMVHCGQVGVVRGPGCAASPIRMPRKPYRACACFWIRDCWSGSAGLGILWLRCCRARLGLLWCCLRRCCLSFGLAAACSCGCFGCGCGCGCGWGGCF